MQVLLDTHAFLWWLEGSVRLSEPAQKAILDDDTEVFVSAVSAWEITTKHRIGKLPGAAMVAADVSTHVASQGFTELPITLAHGQAAGALSGPHRDPFDRMLIAQAMLERLVLVSNEELFDAYGVKRLW